MKTLEEIRSAIEELSLEEQANLIANLVGEPTDDEWDAEMKDAFKLGKFDPMNRETDQDLQNHRQIDLGRCSSE